MYCAIPGLNQLRRVISKNCSLFKSQSKSTLSLWHTQCGWHGEKEQWSEDETKWLLSFKIFCVLRAYSKIFCGYSILLTVFQKIKITLINFHTRNNIYMHAPFFTMELYKCSQFISSCKPIVIQNSLATCYSNSIRIQLGRFSTLKIYNILVFNMLK